MAQRRRFTQNKRQAARLAPQTRTLHVAPAFVERQTVVYGKPFIVVEDAAKNTLYYKAGAWIPYSASIAECKQTCKVKELPQRLNGMIRYEVRCPE
ncbi:MAG: hypothetical protein WD872_08100 [Pirellulaceae bacterium]